MFFVRQTLWPSGGSVDWIAASICAAAMLALFKWRRGVIKAICGAALIGIFVAAMGQASMAFPDRHG